MCERTVTYWKHTSSFLSLFPCARAVSLLTKSCWFVLWNRPSPHSYIYKARLQPHQTVTWGLPCLQALLVFCNCFLWYLPNQLLLFVEQDAAHHHLKHSTDQNKWPCFLLSGRLTNRCPGITPSQWRDTGSAFVCEFTLLTRKCHVFLDQTVPKCWMSGRQSTCINMLEVFCSDSRRCVTPPGPCCSVARLHPLFILYIMCKWNAPFQVNETVYLCRACI